MYFGFHLDEDGVREISPSVFGFASKKARRIFFITQFNACMDATFRLPLHICTNDNLHDVFVKKIKLLANDKSFNMCKNSKLILEYFFRGDFVGMEKFCFSKLDHPSAKLAQMIYAKEDKGLCFDARILFSNYVYDKIHKIHKDKDISYDNDVIIVSKNGKDIMGIMPCFKYINPKEKEKVSEDIRKAYEMLERRDLEKLFIAYPRNEEFTKHIIVKKSQRELAPKLTLVPYSISHRVSCRS